MLIVLAVIAVIGVGTVLVALIRDYKQIHRR